MNRVFSAPMVLMVCVTLGGCWDEDGAAPALPRPVMTTLAEPVSAGAVQFAGTVEPKVHTQLGFRALGRLIALNVSVGDSVHEGQPLAAIDPTVFELTVRSAEADLSSARAQLSNASGAVDRRRSLLKSGSATEASVETAQQQFLTARASVDRARANLAKAREQLANARLVAEFDGVVTKTSAEVGQIVTPGEAVVTIARPDLREAVVDIPDGLVPSLNTGDVFDVALELDPSIRAKGAVREMAPQADLVTRTRRVRIELDRPAQAFRLGTNVIAMRAMADGNETVQLPASALLERDGRTFVWIVDPDSAEVARREVLVVSRADGTVLVDRRPDASSRIVTAGVNALEDGQKVRLYTKGAQ